MASRNFVHPWTLNRGVVFVGGSFAPNGSSAISNASNEGLGWQVARTNTGLYTITFSDKYAALISFTVTLQLASAADTFLQAGTYTAASRTITVRNYDISGTGVADIAADANNRIHFLAMFRNSEVMPVRGA